MRRLSCISPLAAGLLIAGTLTAGLGVTSVAGASTTAQSCATLTKAVIVADGYAGATGPKITPYNYSKASANATNALGTTYDFGPKALVIGCVSPADIKKLSAAASKPTMTSIQYMAYMVKQAAGAMKKTPVGGVSDYLDFGNGKEDGLGSTATAGSVRLDAWVAGNYIVLTFTAPVVATPTKALLNLIKTTQTLLK